MENYHEVSVNRYTAIISSLVNDDQVCFAKFVDLNLINYPIRIVYQTVDGRPMVKQKSAPLLITTLNQKAFKCTKWLLDHNANPNVTHDFWTVLMWACHNDNPVCLLLKYGAKVYVPTEGWPHVCRLLQWSEHKDVYLMLSRMFLLGLNVPEDSDIPYVCRKVQWFLRQRESACRRACYAFLLDARLPRDLVRWMLTRYVLSSKRESIWNFTNIKMPPGFEILD